MTGPGSHRTSKVVSLDEAIGLVHTGATLGVGGAGGVQEPDALLEHLAKTYKVSGAPGGLTEFHAIRTGEVDGRGTSLFGAKGFVNKMIGGSFWPVGTPELIRRILDNEIAAYNFSIGAIYAMLEATAAGRPGFVTTVGLDTFVDPVQQGGALNASAAAVPMVERVEIGGQPLLYYHQISTHLFFMNDASIENLPEAHRQTVLDLIREAGNVQIDATARLSEELLDTLRSQPGVTVSDVDTAPFAEKLSALQEEVAADLGVSDLVEIVKSH